MPDDVIDARVLLAKLINELRMHERAAERIRKDMVALQSKMTEVIDEKLRRLRPGPDVGGRQTTSIGTRADCAPLLSAPAPHAEGRHDGSDPDGMAEGNERMRPRRSDSSGSAPRGFAANVRRIAHRSIAEANRPLERAEIIEDIRASGMPLPKTFLPQKVSRVLARDEDLVNHRGEGYTLTDRALSLELAAMRRK